MIHVRTLGTAEVLADTHRITPGSSILFGLALFLSVNAGQRIQRSRLLELFWPRASDTSRRHALRQLLYRLRRAGFPINVDGEELLVPEDAVESDIGRILCSRWPDHACEDEIRAAAVVLPGYDPPMPEEYREWLDELRSRAHSQYRRAVLRQIDTSRRGGRWHDVDDWSRRCLEVDPLNEEATLARAEAIAMSGSKAQALQIIDQYLNELGDHRTVIGLPAKVLRRRVSEATPSQSPGESEHVPLVGREAEVARLVTSLNDTLTGRGRAVLIEGAAGMGKSRLVHELLVTASLRGWRTVSTRLQPGDAERPLGLFVDLLGSLMQLPGALGAAPDSLAQIRLLTEHELRTGQDSDRSREAEAVQERLRKAALDLLDSVVSEGPLVVFVDDLHWCDDHSQRLLNQLISHSSGLPVMWALTTRHEGRSASLHSTMPDVRADSLQLKPLTQEAAGALFLSMCGGASTAWTSAELESASAATGGNPLFVLEFARHVRDTGKAQSLPASLQELIRERAARLSKIAQHVLYTCAVLGRYASVPRVSSVLDIGPGDLLVCMEELDGLGIVGAGSGGEALSIHDLWRQELLSRLLPASQKLLHHRCGVVLETECRQRRSPSMVWEAAQHLLASGSEGRALSLIEESAQHQLDNGLPSEAANSFDMAFRIATTDADRARAVARQVNALRYAADWVRLSEVVGGAIVLAEREGLQRGAHSALELLQIEALWRTETDTALSFQRALECACDETAGTNHRMSALVIAAITSANLARVSMLTPVMTIVEGLPKQNSEDRVAWLIAKTIYNTEAGDLDTARDSAAQLIEAERLRGSVRGLTRALRFASYPLRCLGDYGAAFESLREALDLAESRNLVGDSASAADSLVNMFLEQGDIPAAERWTPRAKGWSALVHARYARTGPAINDAIMAIAAGNFQQVYELIEMNPDAHAKDPVVRQKLLNLSVIVRTAASCREMERLLRATAMLGETLRDAQTIGRVDYAVASFAIGLVALGDSATATQFVERYLHRERRDRSKPPHDLLRHLEQPRGGCGPGLYGGETGRPAGT